MSERVPDSMTTRGLEAFLHEKIPLTKAMGLHVAESNAQHLVLEAPLAANVNHLGTAFGGSLHALPTLACYAVLWTLLREAGLDGHVVVKRSAAQYRVPVTGRLRAICERPAPAVVGDGHGSGAEAAHDPAGHEVAASSLASYSSSGDGLELVDGHEWLMFAG